jgi:hypothetical protein
MVRKGKVRNMCRFVEKHFRKQQFERLVYRFEGSKRTWHEMDSTGSESYRVLGFVSNFIDVLCSLVVCKFVKVQTFVSL